MARRTGVGPAENYLVGDVLAPNLNIVFCGTALGHESYRQRAYYANPGNQFWPVLYRIGLTPRQLKPAEYREAPTFGIGLTDLCKTSYGNDHELAAHQFDRVGLEKKIKRCQPKILAFTSKNAASLYLGKPTGKIDYGFQQERIGNTRLYALPSPSGRARSWWKEEVWVRLKDAISSLPPS